VTSGSTAAELRDSPGLAGPPGSGGQVERPPTLELIASLCRVLDVEGIRYCHWKSNEALDRSASGDNDLDLLIGRSDADRFETVIRRLGFRDAKLPRWKELPGVYHTYGLDRASGRFVHIHAHYQLVIGDDMTKNYRLPIENAYLASATPSAPFLVPAPEFELGLFLVRMVIKHSTWDAFLTFQSSLSKSERRERDYLLARVDLGDVWELMSDQLPSIDRDLWTRCLRATERGNSAWFRIRTAARLQRALAGLGRRPRALDTYLRMWRRFRTVVRRKLLRRGPLEHPFAAGGVLVGIVGSDGSGKSTVISGLAAWFASEDLLARTLHMGKPRRSLASIVLKSPMKLAASLKRRPTSSASSLRSSLTGDGKPMSIRDRARLRWEILTARDRFRAYRRARRLASNGAIVVCDRFPIPEVVGMDGAVTARAADPARWGPKVASLAARERSYYARIGYPDILIVLRVDPDLAVQRKAGVEPESVIRPRAEEIWNIDWDGTPAIVVDAGASAEDVLSEVKSLVWSGI
jgi:thymidylate kinase